MAKSNFLNKLKKDKKIELVNESIEISKSYSIKSDNCVKSAKILFRENLYENSISESYYAMYNVVLSLLFRCGIKCENHAGSILLLKELFQLKDFAEILNRAKKERIDKQYYVTTNKNDEISEEDAKQMIEHVENLTLNFKTIINKLNNEEINKIRIKFNEI